MLDQVGNIVVGPTFVERVFRPGRRSFLDHRLVNYCNGLQVALLADDVEQDDGQGYGQVPDAPPDVVVESGVMFPRMNKWAPSFAFFRHVTSAILQNLKC